MAQHGHGTTNLCQVCMVYHVMTWHTARYGNICFLFFNNKVYILSTGRKWRISRWSKKSLKASFLKIYNIHHAIITLTFKTLMIWKKRKENEVEKTYWIGRSTVYLTDSFAHVSQLTIMDKTANETACHVGAKDFFIVSIHC